MMFHPKFLFLNLKLFRSAPIWQKHVLQSHFLLAKHCESIQVCKRHMYLLSSSKHSSFRTYQLNDGHSAWCMCEFCQKQRKMMTTGIPAINYKTLSSHHRRHSLSRQCWNAAVRPHKVLFTGGQRSLNTREILEACPSKFQPYLRLIRFDKPIGTFLLFWPCTWSISLAAPAGHLPDFYLLALFGLGSFIMRGAGCIINDMWDKDFDRRVARTKTRPLACGELTQFQALQFLGLNLSIALAILLQLNWYSVFVGATSMLLVITYPLAKRYTYWPQAMLGLTQNWGVLIAWSHMNETYIGWPALTLYLACALHSMLSDTIYSHQDKEYDMLIGVKSTALKFGDDTKKWLTGFASGMLGFLSVTGYLCDQTWPYYAGVALTGAHLAHQIYTVDLEDADDCMKKFRSNTQLGAILFIGIIIGTLIKPEKDEKKKNSEHS